MQHPSILVTVSLEPDEREAIETDLSNEIECRFLDDIDPPDRPRSVADADGLLSMRPHRELGEEAFEHLHDGQVVQAITAGIDFLPFDRFPDGIVLQSNVGAYAEPVAEHVVAMYLALAKRLRIEHEKLLEGEFDQFRPNRQVSGSRCGIIGFGEIGKAAARKLGALGVSILAINRRGESDLSTDFIGTPDDIDSVLQRADGIVLSAPLTEDTRHLIDRAALRTMPDDGMLINIARGELIEQEALYDHLRANPTFQAGIDAWWTEPVRHGEFSVEYPFLELPNVLGSPHNAAQIPGIREYGLRQALDHLVTALTSDDYVNVVDPSLGY